MKHDTQPLYIDGRYCYTSDTFQTIDPSTNLPLADVCKAGADLVDEAVKRAQSAITAWSRTPPVERSRILLLAATLLREKNDELARIETADTGRPFSETSTVDINTGADVLEFYAHLVAGGGLDGTTIQLRPNAAAHMTKSPLGVCAGIGAWNYPIQIALWKSGPCLAAGNCMVYKPSEFTPLHAIRLAEIYAEAGLPGGVFNVVHGGGDVGAQLVSHPGIAKVSFTGQIMTGSKVASSAAKDMKHVTMELGGKSPCLILPDADLESAVDGAMMANFFSSGQVCTNGTRVFVPQSLRSRFETRLLEKMRNIRAGHLMDLTTNFGPLVSKTHLEKVTGYIRHGMDVDHAELLCGGITANGVRQSQGVDNNGFWVDPTVFTNCTDDMLIARDEIFGPVMCILPYEDSEPDFERKLVSRANSTPTGLAAGIFSRDVAHAQTIINQIEAGINWINTWGQSPAEMSVGGWKMSGLGVENGTKGLESWVQNKSTLLELSGQVGSVFK